MSRLSIPPKTKRVLFFILFLAAIVTAHSLVTAQTKPSPHPDDALLFREGEVLFGKGEIEKALWRFKRLTIEYPKSPLFNEAQFRMGICYTQLKKPTDGIRTLNDLLATFLAPARMVQVLGLLGDNYLELKDPVHALHWFGKGLLVPGQPNDELKGKVKAILDTMDTEEALNKVETLYRGAYAGGYARLRIARIVKRRGDTSLVRKIVTDLEKEYSGMDYLPLARELLDRPGFPRNQGIPSGSSCL